MRLRLIPLQARHAVTTFIHVSVPPRDTGRIWSRVSRRKLNPPPQYAQMWRSPATSPPVVGGGTWLKPFLPIALPLIPVIQRPPIPQAPPVPPALPPRDNRSPPPRP